MPVVLYQMIMFAAPGLTPREKRYVLVSVPGIILSFAAGVVFAWFILIPPALNFLLTFGGDVAEANIRIGRYINLILALTLWVGLSFQTPLVMTLLSRLGVVKPSSFAKRRKMAIVGAFIAAAVFTPTFDPVNQTLLASPIIVLYEIGIWLSKLANRRRVKAAEKRMLELEQ
jgi:sec-independent protein translocase protein TatC